MDGHCFGCATKFGFFTKEHGCHKCGHAYCKSCVPHKAVIPGKGSSKPQHVCVSCYKLLQQPQADTQSDNIQNEGRYSPPENFKKRVAALHQQQQQGAQGSRPAGAKCQASLDDSSAGAAKQAAKYKKLAPEDRDIAMRLDKLQEERKKKQKTPLTESEIEDRLRKLRGLPATSETSQPNVYQPPPNKTLEEQHDDLLDQMSEEAALDARLEGREIPAAGQPMSSHQVPSRPHPGLGGDPLIPSEDELKQLVDDAKKLLGAQDPSSDGQPAGTPGSQTQGGSSGAGESRMQDEGISEEARRLAEEASRLMESARSEVACDKETAKRDAEKYAEISGRLAQLQSQQSVTDPTASGYVQDSDDEDEEKASQRLIQQLLEESKLDEKVASDGFEVPTKKTKPHNPSKPEITDQGGVEVQQVEPKVNPKHPTADPDELPWCCICNEDAVLRCLDCDDDLYCKRCFREGHRDFGIECHKVKPYKQPEK